MILKVEYCGVQVIENAPFMIDRPEGSYRYIFFHFTSQVSIYINNEIFIAQPGTCILYTPKEAQKFFVEKNRLNHDYIDFILEDESFFKNISFPLNTPFNPKESSFITNIIKIINEEKNGIQLGGQIISEIKTIELFTHLSRTVHHNKSFTNIDYSNALKLKFEKIRLDMYQLPDKIKVSSLAKSLGFSLSRFNELYKQYFNTTPVKDLTKARISRVDDLIKQGYSTKEIIKKIGFSSEEYFYRWFKKNFNTTKENYVKSLYKKGE